MSATYGGVDVTNYAKVLFNYGDSIRIRTVEPGFHEPWKGVIKTISVFHELGKSQRIFACREYMGERSLHVLGPYKNISDQKVQDADLYEATTLTVPANSKITILAIVWGPRVVRAQSVYDYFYSKVGNGNVEWRNENMGGDPWSGYQKSGAIYYKVNGSSDVRQCTGREGSSTSLAP